MSAPSYTEQNVVPHGKDTGGQEGRLDPGRRVYRGEYEAVDLTEASRRASMRKRGSLPIIKGGIDDQDPSLLQEHVKREIQKEQQIKKNAERASAVAALKNPPTSFDDYDRIYKEIHEEKTQPIQFDNSYWSTLESVLSKYFPGTQKPAETEDPKTSDPFLYLSERKSIIVHCGTMTLRAKPIDVLEDQYGITLLFPSNADDTVFIPDPGSEVQMDLPTGKNLTCYYPGVKFKAERLGVIGLMFLKRPTSEE